MTSDSALSQGEPLPVGSTPGEVVVGCESIRVSSVNKEHLDLLLQSSALLNSTLDLDEVLKYLLEEASRIVGAENGFILLKEADDWIVHLTIAEDRPFSRSVATHAAESGKTLMVIDAVNDDRFMNTTSVVLSGLRSILCAPLTWDREIRGVVYLDNNISQGVFLGEHQRLIEALSQQASGAIENAALHRERERLHDEAMKRAREELAQTQAQLFTASKMAAVGELAAGLAHEVNNPLCAIALNLDTVSKQVEGPGLGRRLEIMTLAVERCRGIIDRLLRFSHSSMAEWKSFRLDHLVSQTLELMQYQLRDIDIECDLEPLTVEGDASAIVQVLINLLSNCNDAVPDEGARIEIRCCASGVLQIQDNGCGMTCEVRERLFEPFFTTKTVGEGTGLGLAVSYQILKDHSAQIEVESEPDAGTLVRLTFTPREALDE
jgi:C4-dicarboxylate-specific signal transduction histidine kinase